MAVPVHCPVPVGSRERVCGPAVALRLCVPARARVPAVKPAAWRWRLAGLPQLSPLPGL